MIIRWFKSPPSLTSLATKEIPGWGKSAYTESGVEIWAGAVGVSAGSDGILCVAGNWGRECLALWWILNWNWPFVRYGHNWQINSPDAALFDVRYCLAAWRRTDAETGGAACLSGSGTVMVRVEMVGVELGIDGLISTGCAWNGTAIDSTGETKIKVSNYNNIMVNAN